MTVPGTQPVQTLRALLHVRATLASLVAALHVLISMSALSKPITVHQTARAPTHMARTHANVTKVLSATDLVVTSTFVPCVTVLQHAMVIAVYALVDSLDLEFLVMHQANTEVLSKRQPFH